MLLLKSTDVLRVVTGSAANVEVNASYVDRVDATTFTPDRPANAVITTATTTTLVGSPSSGVVRNVKDVSAVNTHASSSSTIDIEMFDGTTASSKSGVITLRPGERVAMDDMGVWRHFDANGAIYTGAAGPAEYYSGLGILNTVAETANRMLVTETNLAALTSGTLFMQAIYLRAGQVCTNISFFSATTAAGTPTNQFFALYDNNRALLAQSANATTGAWAANTLKTLAMTAPFTATYTGLHYVGIMVTATTVPTLKGTSAAKTGGQLAGTAPILHGNSTTALTTSLPNPAAAITVGLNSVWAAIT
jgi:hypothetical protein